MAPLSDRHDDELDPVQTGHDLHFLQRLERFDLHTTDLALRLYRDPDLVRALFADSSCPPGADRVALALADDPAPPFVILERSGAFVTCLAAGMEVGATPVLSWTRLAVHLARADREARETRLAESFSEKGITRRLINRLYTAGAALSREEFGMLTVVEPLLHSHLFSDAFRMWAALLSSAADIRRTRPGARDAPRRQAFWQTACLLGHLLLLISHRGHRGFELVEALADKAPPERIFHRLFFTLVDYGYAPLAFRALWAVGLAGKMALPALKQHLVAADSLSEWLGPAAMLVTMGLRHHRLRAEVGAALGPSRLPAEVRTHPRVVKFAATFRDGLSTDYSHEFDPAAAAIFAGMSMCSLEDQLEDTGAEAFARDPLILPRVLNRPCSLHENPVRLTALPLMVRILGHLPVGAFYFPAAAIAEAPRLTERNLDELVQSIAPPPARPVRSEPRVGRNDPCPCGSGKKHKKCCGAGG